MLLVEDDLLPTQLERILHSDTFRHSEVLRRLLRFLAEKSLSGEADYLKEYTLAVEGLGKPPTYDPRHDSTVRIQVGRLRQKLTEYYLVEGKDDSVVIDLPKGRFKLTCEQRLPAAEKTREDPKARPLQILLWLVLALATCLGFYFAGRLSRGPRAPVQVSGWTPELEELWRPFLQPTRPLIVTVEDPLFVELHKGPGVFYRDRSLNKLEDLMSSSGVVALRGALKNAPATPSRPYTAFGEVTAVFLVGKFLGLRQQNISLVRTSELSWQQLADSNVVFVGNVGNLFYDEQLHGMPIEPQLVPAGGGIRNIHPAAGEPALFSDQSSTAFSKEGVAYALVTHLPGPLGSNDVESFSSEQPAGYVGAVRWFTDASSAGELVTKLRKASGGLPRYYQVLLKVKFEHEIPTETTFVLSRELP